MNTIGRYQITGELGAGGMGVVYRARDAMLGRSVAIKTVLLPEHDTEAAQTSLERLLREARAAANLSHPNIVGVYDLVEQGGLLYIVMELVEGEPLSKLLASGRQLSVPEKLRIIKETAEGLDYAHAQGVVHRDVKPANILVQPGAGVKIADFGIAKLTAAQAGQRQLTQEGTLVGTPDYVPPEQIRGDKVDGRADQFSLAVVAYQLSTNRLPFAADSIIALAHRIVSEPPHPAAELTPAQASVIARALSKAPAQRFENCAAFAASMEAVFLAEGAASRSKLPIYAVAGVLLASLAAGGLYYASRQQREKAPSSAVAETKALSERVKPPAAQTPSESQPPAHTTASEPDKNPKLEVEKTSVIAPVVKPSKQTSSKPKDPPAAESPARPGSTRTNSTDGQLYVWVPAGAFEMGCVPGDSECLRNEKPAHTVTLSKGFWLGQTETTVAAYKRYTLANGKAMPKAPQFDQDWSKEDHPIVNVTWAEANAYCEWAGGRLPTEAEWEYAARAGRPQEMYITGSAFSHDDANYGTDEGGLTGEMKGKDRWKFTSPVRGFMANPWNFFDLSGNAAEWCADWFAPDVYSNSPAQDPKGPANQTGDAGKVIRGGSWASKKSFMRLSHRINREADHAGSTFGFRCAADRLP